LYNTCIAVALQDIIELSSIFTHCAAAAGQS